MEKIYSYKFRLPKTGWDCRMVFKKASSDVLGTHEEIILPIGSVGLKNTSWAFDKYPLG